MKLKSPRRLSLLGKVSILAFFIMAAIAVILAWGIQRQLEKNALLQEAESAADQVTNIMNPTLTPADLAGPLDPARFAQIDALIRKNILHQHIVRVKIWNRQGLLLYADDKNLVGRHFTVNEELQEALAGKIAMEVSSLTKEENVGERGSFSRLLEIYVPLRPLNSSQIMGAYEIYHDMAVLGPRITFMRRFVWSSVGLGFLILYGSLFLLVRNASRELVRRNQENVHLYEEAERRLKNLRSLRDIDQAITTTINLRLTLNVVLAQVTTQLAVDAADVLLLKPLTQTLEYAAGRGFRTKAIEASHLHVGEDQAGRAILEHRIQSTADLAVAESTFSRLSLLVDEDFVAYYVAPLIAKGQVKGVLEIFHRAPLKPHQEWLDFLDALATQTAIAIDNSSLFEDLQRSNVELTLAYDATIEGWSRALDLRDKETEGHTQRVTAMTLKLGRKLGISEAELIHMRRGALLHDIGKMGIPDSILLKPASLTDEEWEIMRRHTVYAMEMLWPIVFLRPALDIPYCHHEKWDGSGYPRGLKEEQIPLAARIFTVVDVWDALSSDRPYRAAWPLAKVKEYLRRHAGSLFETRMVELLLEDLEHNPSSFSTE